MDDFLEVMRQIIVGMFIGILFIGIICLLHLLDNWCNCMPNS
jgi:hypothetical protein